MTVNKKQRATEVTAALREFVVDAPSRKANNAGPHRPSGPGWPRGNDRDSDRASDRNRPSHGHGPSCPIMQPHSCSERTDEANVPGLRHLRKELSTGANGQKEDAASCLGQAAVT